MGTTKKKATSKSAKDISKKLASAKDGDGAGRGGQKFASSKDGAGRGGQ